MYLQRKIDVYLKEWKQDEHRRPLIVKGARQIGKTESIRKFAEENYKHVVEINFVEEPKYKMITSDGYGVQNIIKNIERAVQSTYQAEYGCIYEINNKTRLERACDVEVAVESDAAEIARLIGMDQGLGGHYSQEMLERQIRNRIHTGTGRSYIIREKGRIAAHTASYAETEKYAVISGTIIHPACRDRGYYPIISSHIVQKLKEEGKGIYTFAVEPRMIQYHNKMDDRRGSYGRLMLCE